MLRQLAVACALACMALPVYAQSPERGVQRGMTVELSGGYAYTNFNAGLGYPNVNGFYGSVGINITHWLQAYGDGSEQYGSITNGNIRIYGDHFGARFYYRPRYSMVNPFAEVLFGISKLTLNFPQAQESYSQNGFSYKAGGGVDLAISRHWSVRAFNADYYRTPFLQTHQNNLWLSAGVVFKFGEQRYPR
jgi:opacity protein-like surface antigen